MSGLYLECQPTGSEGGKVIEVKSKDFNFSRTSAKKSQDFSYILLGFTIFAVIGYGIGSAFGDSKKSTA